MKMSQKWLIIGISGVTCGGKTTLAKQLVKSIPDSIMISQDTYFNDVDDPRHTWIPELNHINFDILSSLDMEKMLNDIKEIIKNRTETKNHLKEADEKCNLQNEDLEPIVLRKMKDFDCKILIVEGFCIFNDPEIEKLCDIKYFFKLDQEECYKRRVTRVYDPPDCPGYFEDCVWPEYLKQLDIQKNVKNIIYFNGKAECPIKKVLLDIYNVI